MDEPKAVTDEMYIHLAQKYSRMLTLLGAKTQKEALMRIEYLVERSVKLALIEQLLENKKAPN